MSAVDDFFNNDDIVTCNIKYLFNSKIKINRVKKKILEFTKSKEVDIPECYAYPFFEYYTVYYTYNGKVYSINMLLCDEDFTKDSIRIAEAVYDFVYQESVKNKLFLNHHSLYDMLIKHHDYQHTEIENVVSTEPSFSFSNLSFKYDSFYDYHHLQFISNSQLLKDMNRAFNDTIKLPLHMLKQHHDKLLKDKLIDFLK